MKPTHILRLCSTIAILLLSLTGLWSSPPTGTSKPHFIGDPCYAFDKNWGDMAQRIITEKSETMAITNSQGKPFLMKVFQVDGDGAYQTDNGEELSVDSGLLACIPMDFWTSYPEELDSLGIVENIDSTKVKKEGDKIIFDTVEISLTYGSKEEDSKEEAIE
jgi:hypothetical protein